MTRTIQLIIGVALLINIASAATKSVTLTSATFAAAPSKVFDSTTGAADATTWNAFTSVIYGPGTDNSTVYAYGVAFTSAATIDKVASRKINASAISNGTADTTLSAKMGDDVTSSPATATSSTTLKTAVGYGSLALAYVGPTSGSNACPQVFVQIYNGGTGAALVTKQVTSYTCSSCTTGTAGTGVGYALIVNNVFYSNSTYYVTWTATKYTETEVASGNLACTSPFPTANTLAKVQVEVDLQGVGATSSGTLTYTKEIAVFSGTQTTNIATDPSPTAAQVNPVCGPSNYSNTSTITYCAYVSAVAAGPLNTWSLVQVSNGTVGSPATIATDVAGSGTYPQTSTAYTPAGFVHSLTQQGVLLNKADTIVSAQTNPTTTYANTLMLYNLTSGASATAGGVAFSPSITNTVQNGAIAAEGQYYTGGFGIINNYLSGAAATTGEVSAWATNGSNIATKQTYATGDSAIWTSNYFVDANGALWAGAYSYDDSTSKAIAGTLGKLVPSSWPTSTFGTVLSSFFALISLVVAVLFVF